MSLPSWTYAPRLLPMFRAGGALHDMRFTLLDVGASGGIDDFFRQFAPQLRAVGFDPLVSEVRRLNAEEEDDGVTYEDYWVGSGRSDSEPDTSMDGSSYYGISSSQLAQDAVREDFIKEHFNSGAEVVLSDRETSLDAWCLSSGIGHVDIVKVDTDGHDYHVIVGMHDLLSGENRPLALITEAQFQERTTGQKDVFGEIDCALRNVGYRLVDIDIRRHSRSDLPQPFCYDIFAQTTRGAVGWCDALYMPDPVLDEAVFDEISRTRGAEGFVKLLVLYDMFGLED
ncbi:MAG: FkbM family methyltransferase, partial [Jannaschia sp.]